MWRAINAMIMRDLTRMVRQRGRLVSAMVRPLIWLFVIGSGFDALLSAAGTPNYRQFLVPGLLCMVMLFGALLASLSMVYDKESGVMRMLIVAPFPRYVIILARTASATMVGLTQALMLILILLPLGYLADTHSVGLLVVGLVCTALLCASVGTLIAVFSKALDDFAVVMNFFIFPMYFLSGALYPIGQLPDVLKALVLINPFSYGVDLMKHALAARASPPFGAEFALYHDLLVLVGFSALALSIACYRFSQAPVFETLARMLSHRKSH